MDQDDKPEPPSVAKRPALSPQKEAEKRRLAEALRANLRRRKAQLRERRGGKADSDASES